MATSPTTPVLETPTGPVPLPPKGKYIESVRTSSKRLRGNSRIKIDLSSIDTFLHSLLLPPSTSKTHFLHLSKNHGLPPSLPLSFPTLKSKINFFSLLALLNVASPYRETLHRLTGKGAWQNMMRFCLGVYLEDSAAEQSKFTAKGMQSFSNQNIASLLAISTHTEKEHPTLPGVMVGEMGEGMKIVELLQSLMKEAGEEMEKEGWQDWDDGVRKATKDGLGGDEWAEEMVEKFVQAIPGFRDMMVIDGEPVYIFKKIFFLIHLLHTRLSTTADLTDLPLPKDLADLPMFVDNVIPTMLVHLGIIDLSECVEEELRDAQKLIGKRDAEELKTVALGTTKSDTSNGLTVLEGPELSHEAAYRLRASGIDAGVEIVKRARELASSTDPSIVGEGEKEKMKWFLDEKEMNEIRLDGYLWSVAKKDGELRNVCRMVERGTIFY